MLQKNEKLTSPKIQKAIVQCFSKEILKSICEEIGNDLFAILVDESSDMSKKEQMAMVLRYVNSLGIVKEIFVGIVHVKDTTSLTLKEAIDSVFTNNNLSISQEIFGQEILGCYIVVVAVAHNHDVADDFFEQLALVVNVVCTSCKRKYIIRDSYKKRVQKEIGNGEIEITRGLNRETSVVRARDTRWGSHYKTIISLKNLFPEVVKVLKYVEEEGSSLNNRNQAYGILSYFKTLDFVFYLHLMLDIFGFTNTLSKHLQRKDQNILEAASLVKVTMKTLKALRNNGFPSMLEKVFSFSRKHEIEIVEMSGFYVTPRNRRTKVTNQHHFEVDIFNTVLDMQIQEFGDCFSEVSTDLLEYMAALSPCNTFSMFDKSKLVKLSELYKIDFNDLERVYLDGQLETYYHSLIDDDRFANLKGIADLSRLMMEIGKHRSFPLVYRLLKLTLVLPVATATVERCFSAMKLLKTDLQKEVLMDVKIERVIERFRKMGNHRCECKAFVFNLMRMMMLLFSLSVFTTPLSLSSDTDNTITECLQTQSPEDAVVDALSSANFNVYARKDSALQARRHTGVSTEKESPVNFLTDPLEGRSALKPTDVLDFGWDGGKNACVHLTGDPLLWA
ncbi:uncharacterized protein LOC111892447 [Lactuca sativa]|uniref:uncharacterized protein LOC111892447 n=1 Tax=Lactuca sativa TaxID=4236 RepID=UPI000CD8263B|nr:uncharacterized protein LOC111892447 [Lactuca sativa]